MKPTEIKQLEERVSKLKSELSKISEERWRAALARDERGTYNARTKAAKKTLENVNAIAKYVANFSEPIAREIESRENEARRTLEQVALTNDPKLFHSWVKDHLVPSAKIAERMGHMAASTAVRLQTDGKSFHKWS